MYKPSPREAALLLLRLITEESRTRGFSRTEKTVRLSERTLKRLWNRERLTEQFLEEVQEWLLSGGWALVFAGSTFGAARVDAVENWSRVSFRRLARELDDVVRGEFDFNQLEYLLSPEGRAWRSEADADE